jgi:hypothetical protein
MKKHINIIDIDYVRSVLAEKVASSVADGDLEPPAEARCRTRSGFRAWLKRAEKEEAIEAIAKAEGRTK